LRPFVAFAFLALLAAASTLTARADVLAHTVVHGESLWSIAQANHISVARLEALNHLTDQSVLQIGQAIVLGTTPQASPAQRHAKIVMRASRRRTVVRRVAAARGNAAVPEAATNAMWVATHTGEAPAPPVSVSIAMAQRILAFDERVTHTALRYIGVPYVWGGTSFDGVDCSGFVYAVFEHNGIDLPRTADSQFEVGRPVATRDLEPGDLVFFETYAPGASHVGIYLGGGRFVHASSSDGVRIDDLSMDYYASRFIGARRLIR